MEGPEDPQGTPGRQDDSSLEGLTHAWGRVAVNNSWVNGLAETLKCTSPFCLVKGHYSPWWQYRPNLENTRHGPQPYTNLCALANELGTALPLPEPTL